MAFDDLRKAFGWVSHAILLHKLTSQLGIQGNLLTWLTNYLTDRTQFSVVNGLHSTVLNVTCGIPRGSVLGPQLFTLYTNDQPSAGASGSLFIYADDTTIFSCPARFPRSSVSRSPSSFSVVARSLSASYAS